MLSFRLLRIGGGKKSSGAPAPLSPSVCPQLRARPWLRPSILPSPESSSTQVGKPARTTDGPTPREAPPPRLGPNVFLFLAKILTLALAQSQLLPLVPSLASGPAPQDSPLLPPCLCQGPTPSLALPKACLGPLLTHGPASQVLAPPSPPPRSLGSIHRLALRCGHAPPPSGDPALSPPSPLAPTPRVSPVPLTPGTHPPHARFRSGSLQPCTPLRPSRPSRTASHSRRPSCSSSSSEKVRGPRTPPGASPAL